MKIEKINKFILTFSLVFTIFFLTINFTIAREANITVSPVVKSINYDSSTTSSYLITIYNGSDTEYSLETNTFELLNNGNEYIKTAISESVVIKTLNSICAINEQCEIEIVIEKGLLEVDNKTHTIAILISFTPTQNTNQNMFQSKQEVISLLNLNLTDDILKYSIIKSEIRSTSPKFVVTPSYNFCIKVSNESELILYPYGYTKIESPNKLTLTDTFSYQNLKGLKPNTEDEKCYKWEREGFQNLSLGKYTIKNTTFPTSNQENPIYSELSFIYIPWQIIATSTGIIFIITSMILIVKFNNRKKE